MSQLKSYDQFPVNVKLATKTIEENKQILFVELSLGEVGIVSDHLLNYKAYKELVKDDYRIEQSIYEIVYYDGDDDDLDYETVSVHDDYLVQLCVKNDDKLEEVFMITLPFNSENCYAFLNILRDYLVGEFPCINFSFELIDKDYFSNHKFHPTDYFHRPKKENQVDKIVIRIVQLLFLLFLFLDSFFFTLYLFTPSFTYIMFMRWIALRLILSFTFIGMLALFIKVRPKEM